jgi:hypothetical protein
MSKHAKATAYLLLQCLCPLQSLDHIPLNLLQIPDPAFSRGSASVFLLLLFQVFPLDFRFFLFLILALFL